VCTTCWLCHVVRIIVERERTRRKWRICLEANFQRRGGSSTFINFHQLLQFPSKLEISWQVEAILKKSHEHKIGCLSVLFVETRRILLHCHWLLLQLIQKIWISKVLNSFMKRKLYKQDACSGVHTDLKMTTYVLWCSIQESSRKPQANCMDF
jgi:hypothetical protein